jgi:hypothetical protein
MDDRDVEQALRAGLGARADEADVTAPVAARTREVVARRWRTRWSVGGAAAAVVLVVGSVALLTRGDHESGQEPPSVADSGTTEVSPPAAGWRTEYYGGVAVDVPADWGYGGAPLPSARLDVCAPGGPPGYVGRPIVQTDMCTYLRSGWQPAAPYVWLGGNVEPGTYDWDNGYVQETVEVGGVTVTVGSDDAALREQVLASAGESDTRCDASFAGIPPAETGVLDSGDDGPPYAWVCVYRKAEGATRFTLSYATAVDPRDAERALAAEAAAPDQTSDCDYDPFEFAVLLTGVPGDRDARTVYETGCGDGAAHLGSGPAKQMVDAGVRPWAAAGVRANMFYFIGPQG